MLSLKKAKREAMVQRRPAQTKRKNRVFSPETFLFSSMNAKKQHQPGCKIEHASRGDVIQPRPRINEEAGGASMPRPPQNQKRICPGRLLLSRRQSTVESSPPLSILMVKVALSRRAAASVSSSVTE